MSFADDMWMGNTKNLLPTDATYIPEIEDQMIRDNIIADYSRETTSFEFSEQEAGNNQSIYCCYTFDTCFNQSQ